MNIGMWSERSWNVIEMIHRGLPENATLKQRKEALKNGYPFGERRFFPWRAWCKARKQYLARYEPPKPIPESLLKDWR